jgi:hypothetical protein
VVGAECGSLSGVVAYGAAGDYPFLDTAEDWSCGTGGSGFVERQVEVECELYDGQDLPCEAGTYQAEGFAVMGKCRGHCGDEHTTIEGAKTQDDCLAFADCVSVSMAGTCPTYDHTEMPTDWDASEEEWEQFVEALGLTGASFEGEFKLHDGECGDDTDGRSSYYNEVTRIFLFWSEEYTNWFASVLCGSTSGVLAYGGGGLQPFVDTASLWSCAAGSLVSNVPASITCAHYDGQVLPCSPGTYSAEGSAPDGDCENICPAHLPTSLAGSTSRNECFTTGANLIGKPSSPSPVTYKRCLTPTCTSLKLVQQSHCRV